MFKIVQSKLQLVGKIFLAATIGACASPIVSAQHGGHDRKPSIAPNHNHAHAKRDEMNRNSHRFDPRQQNQSVHRPGTPHDRTPDIARAHSHSPSYRPTVGGPGKQHAGNRPASDPNCGAGRDQPGAGYRSPSSYPPNIGAQNATGAPYPQNVSYVTVMPQTVVPQQVEYPSNDIYASNQDKPLGRRILSNILHEVAYEL